MTKKRTDWDEHLLGIDDPDLRALTRKTVLGSDDFAAFARATHEALMQWSSSAFGGDPDPGTRGRARLRLFETLGSPDRFRPFFGELERSFAMTTEALRAVLHKVDDAAGYQTAPMPGVSFFHFTPGEACGFAEAGIVKLAKGARFPRHRHLGHEINFILEGTLIDAGISYGPGALVSSATGSEHDYRAGDQRDLILVAGHSGIAYLEG